jgi:Protein of unknown function (DUF4199)
MSDAPGVSVAARRLLQHAAFYGGIAGGLGGLWLAAEFTFGFFGRGAEIAGMLVPVVAVVIGVMRWRDRAMGGATTFASTFGAALALGLVYAGVVAACAAVYFSARSGTVIDQLVAAQTTLMQQAGVTQEKISEAVAPTRHQITAATFAYALFVRRLLLVFIVSLVASSILPRRRI